MDEVLRGKVTAYPKEDGQKGLVEVTFGALDGDFATVLARAEPLFPGIYWLPELGDTVEAMVPESPGQDAQVVRVRRLEGDGQVASCWTEKNDLKQVKTRAGHTLTFDDTKDAAVVTLRSAGGLTLCLDDGAKTVTVKGSEATPSLTLDMDGDKASLSAGQGLTLRCGGAEISIDGKGNISVSTGGKLAFSAREITISANASLTAKGLQTELSGQTELNLKSGGITQVKGSIIKLN